jgi:uncharacterized protein YceK
MKPAVLSVAAGALLLISGCAYIYTTVAPGRPVSPYAGTKLNVAVVRNGFTPVNGCLPVACDSSQWFQLQFAILDVPFSVVADTVLLPYTQIMNQ